MREYSQEIINADAKFEADLKIKLEYMKITKEEWKKYIFWKRCEQEFLNEMKDGQLLKA